VQTWKEFFMQVWKIKQGIYAFLSVVLATVFCLFFYALNACKFSSFQGRREFYLYSASSQAIVKTQLSISDLNKIKGESVSFLLAETESEDVVVDRVLKKYGASVRFIEENAGVVSYYCYTDKFQNFIMLNGVEINLQIAIDGDRAVLGTPLIFGGF